MDLKTLKARSQDMSATLEAAKKLNAKSEFEDNDSSFWQPQRGKDGNGFARIRFLGAPKVDGDDAVPFVKFFRHSFDGPVSGEWYIENCLTTHNRKDPANDLTRILYKSGTEYDKALAQKYKRKATYVTNILVIDDQLDPASNGQIKKFRFGVKIWEKIENAMSPKIGKSVDPFNFWTGADFGLVTKTVDKYANYDDSRFDSPGPIGDDDLIEKLWNNSYSLKAFLEEKNFKEYDVLKAKLDSVLGFTYAERGSAATVKDSLTVPSPLKPVTAGPAPVPYPYPATSLFTSPAAQPPWEPTPPTATGAGVAGQDEEEMAFLRNLASKK